MGIMVKYGKNAWLFGFKQSKLYRVHLVPRVHHAKNESFVGSYKVRILHSHPEFNSPNHQLVPRNYPGLDRTSWCLCPFHGEPSPADKIHVLPGKLMFPHVLAKIPPITCSTKVYLDFKINSSLQPSRCLALWQRSEATGNPKQKALASLGKDVNPEAWRYAGHPSYCLCN